MRTVLTALSLAALPAVAAAAPLTPALVFMDAAPFPKLIMLGLIGAGIATVAICARKLSAGSLAGGSAFVSGVRLGPLKDTRGAALDAKQRGDAKNAGQGRNGAAPGGGGTVHRAVL